MTKRFLFFAFSLIAGPGVYAADLEMRIVWEGELPNVKKIENRFAIDCRDVDLNADRQFVDAETKGVRDAFVYVASLRGDREQWRQPPRGETVRIDYFMNLEISALS